MMLLPTAGGGEGVCPQVFGRDEDGINITLGSFYLIFSSMTGTIHTSV
jgi:hypothetical protein